MIVQELSGEPGNVDSARVHRNTARQADILVKLLLGAY